MASQDARLKKKPKSLKIGQKVQVKFYTQEITKNGKQKNTIVYDIGENEPNGFRIQMRYFITFWGTYQNEKSWLENKGYVVISNILETFIPVIGKGNNGNTYMAQHITVAIKQKRIDKNDYELGKESYNVSNDSTQNDSDDYLYYGGEENKPYSESNNNGSNFSYTDDDDYL